MSNDETAYLRLWLVDCLATAGHHGPDAWHAACSVILGRPVDLLQHMTVQETLTVIHDIRKDAPLRMHESGTVYCNNVPGHGDELHLCGREVYPDHPEWGSHPCNQKPGHLAPCARFDAVPPAGMPIERAAAALRMHESGTVYCNNVPGHGDELHPHSRPAVSGG